MNQTTQKASKIITFESILIPMKMLFKNAMPAIFIMGLICFTSCSDGDITIAGIDFSELSLQSCGSSTEATLFFKINDTESIALELPSGLLKNSISENTIEQSLNGPAFLTYRIFQGSIAADYYCSSLPTISPNVIRNAEATSGTVLIDSSLSEDGNSFEHHIQLSGVTFIDDQGKRITDLNISDFGVFVTPK